MAGNATRSTTETRPQVDVDFVVYGPSGIYAVEVNSATRVRPEDVRALRSFGEDYPQLQRGLLHRDKQRINLDGVLCVPCEEFLLALHPDHFPA